MTIQWFVTWKGGTAVLVILVLIIGCRPPKTQKVKDDDVEMYWNELDQRDRKSRRLQREASEKNMYSEL